MAGKGSRPRPIKDRKQFSDNWDQIFGKKQQQQPNTLTQEEIEIKKEQAKDPRNG